MVLESDQSAFCLGDDVVVTAEKDEEADLLVLIQPPQVQNGDWSRQHGCHDKQPNGFETKIKSNV